MTAILCRKRKAFLGRRPYNPSLPTVLTHIPKAGETALRHLLIQFLLDREIACQIDNLSVRLLLWPHSMIPQNDFIEDRYDDLFVRGAVARLV